MARPRPIGMRIPRPYDTEEEFIRGDGLAIGRLGMILIGAPKRPPGITIRFEVQLRDGSAVFRGEGRVVAHRIHANGREGLEIRFTRLDSRSKGLVEQVLELRRTGALTPLSATNPPPAAQPDGKTGRLVRSVPPQASEPKPDEQASAQAPESPTDGQPEEQDTTEASESAKGQPEASAPDADEATLESADDEEVVKQAEASVPPVQTGDADELADDGLESEVTDEGSDDTGSEQAASEAEILDEDPTPFAPPVMFDKEHDGREEEQVPSVKKAATPIPPPAVEVSADVTSALSKLRDRGGSYDVPEAAGDLLERLRSRAKAG